MSSTNQSKDSAAAALHRKLFLRRMEHKLALKQAGRHSLAGVYRRLRRPRSGISGKLLSPSSV